MSADDIERLYDEHARSLVAYFARRTFHVHAATELMAETFASAAADRRQFRGDDAARWLYGIARHQLLGPSWPMRADGGGTLTGARVCSPPTVWRTWA